jgi:hypothetical protein
VWAVSWRDGSILHSEGDGKWAYDHLPQAAELFQVSAVSPNEVYVAGADLYRGWAFQKSWDRVDVPPAREDSANEAQTLGRTVTGVSARGPGDVYVVSVGWKAAHLSGGVWKRVVTPPKMLITQVAATASGAYVLAQ